MTGSCPTTVFEGDRTCIAVLDACKKYPTMHLRNLINSQQIKDVKTFYSTGFFINSNFEALKMIMKHAANENKGFAFSLAAEYLLD